MALIDHRIKEWIIGYLKSGNLGDIDTDELVAGIVEIVSATIAIGTIADLDITTNLDINGSLDFKVVTKTANYTAKDEIVILCNAVDRDITITLPAAATHTGRVYYIKKIDSSEHTVTIDGNGTEKIDNDETQIVTTQNASLTVIPDGIAWWII